MDSESAIETANLKEYEIEKDNLKLLLNELQDYAGITNKGQLAESRDYPFSEDGMLDEEEKPDQVGREGESSLSIGYSDFEVLFGEMVGELDYNLSDDRKLDLPEDKQKEAAGALFGASYAIFRHQVMKEGFPAEHDTFRQDIDSQEERERFLEEGAHEIRGEIMGPWGYDHEIMNEVMDSEQALETYKEVAEEII